MIRGQFQKHFYCSLIVNLKTIKIRTFLYVESFLRSCPNLNNDFLLKSLTIEDLAVRRMYVDTFHVRLTYPNI